MTLKCTAILCCILLHCTKHQDCFGLQFTAFIFTALHCIYWHNTAVQKIQYVVVQYTVMHCLCLAIFQCGWPLNLTSRSLVLNPVMFVAPKTIQTLHLIALPVKHNCKSFCYSCGIFFYSSSGRNFCKMSASKTDVDKNRVNTIFVIKVILWPLWLWMLNLAKLTVLPKMV